MIFKPERDANLRDIAQWVGKHASELTMEDMKKVIPESLWDNSTESPFALVRIRDIYEKSKWWQRLNRLWVIPVYVLVIGPFSYIVYGKWHISYYSKIGKVISWLIGE